MLPSKVVIAADFEEKLLFFERQYMLKDRQFCCGL